MSIDEIRNNPRLASVGKYGLNYKVPYTYTIRNKPVQMGSEKKELMPDGPIFTWSKSKRQTLANISKFSKDGKEPPHSYLQLKTWTAKKENKVSSKVKRETYIDDIVKYENKHKYPGPNKYFKEEKKKAAEKKTINPSKLVRPSFLDDAQYLAMNNPAPGSYNPYVQKKSKAEGRSKSVPKKYVPGEWRPKHDQKQAPGDYEVVRVMSVLTDKTTGKKRLANIPTLERPLFGFISKVRS